MKLLEISDLNVTFPKPAGDVRASDNMTLDIDEGESLCLVGETGCGKTVVALSIMQLLPGNAVISGQIRLKGRNLLSLNAEAIRQVRGREVAMIFEQPATCLNPVFTVGDQIAEAVFIHEQCSKKEAERQAIDLMEMVGIPAAAKRYRQYPHEFSGGMQQRTMIAMALAFRPALLIADEPTTSLDVTIQAQILELLKDLIARFNMSLFLITHDLGVAAEMCDSVAVMYAGEIVEQGETHEVFQQPRHPYTAALLRGAADIEIMPVPGSVPELTKLPPGCRFHPRCPDVEDVCRFIPPVMKSGVRCHRCKSR